MISARNYWTNEQLWRDYKYWTHRELVARVGRQSHLEINKAHENAKASRNVLIKRFPGLADPDRIAMDQVEGRIHRSQSC